jgi:hypothetical protein
MQAKPANHYRIETGEGIWTLSLHDGYEVRECEDGVIIALENSLIKEDWVVGQQNATCTTTHTTWAKGTKGRVKKMLLKGPVRHGWVLPSPSPTPSEDPCETCTTEHCLTCHVARARAGLSYD